MQFEINELFKKFKKNRKWGKFLDGSGHADDIELSKWINLVANTIVSILYNANCFLFYKSVKIK